MKVYEFGEQGKPVLMLLPGTGCYWRSNFGKVIEPLAETFRVACVSYDGFDETEQTQFPTMIEETAKIEAYIKTEIPLLYAFKMGEKDRARYHRHFAHPVLHELDMQHEELLAVHPKEWVELIEDICRQK